jgi:hypothetical protein
MSDGQEDQSPMVPSRRAVLVLGAAAASTVVTIRPAFAQTAGSVMNCQIPIPASGMGGKMIAADGSVVPAGTPGAFPPLSRPLTGEEAKKLLQGGSAPAGIDYQSAQAYANYIRRLQPGVGGYSCYASLQNRV